MLIETNLIDDYCEFKVDKDCRACAMATEDGECKYKSFMESYEYLENEIDDSDYEELQLPRCYFCDRPMKRRRRFQIEIKRAGYLETPMVCPTCNKKLLACKSAWENPKDKISEYIEAVKKETRTCKKN